MAVGCLLLAIVLLALTSKAPAAPTYHCVDGATLSIKMSPATPTVRLVSYIRDEQLSLRPRSCAWKFPASEADDHLPNSQLLFAAEGPIDPLIRPLLTVHSDNKLCHANTVNVTLKSLAVLPLRKRGDYVTLTADMAMRQNRSIQQRILVSLITPGVCNGEGLFLRSGSDGRCFVAASSVGGYEASPELVAGGLELANFRDLGHLRAFVTAYASYNSQSRDGGPAALLNLSRPLLVNAFYSRSLDKVFRRIRTPDDDAHCRWVESPGLETILQWRNGDCATTAVCQLTLRLANQTRSVLEPATNNSSSIGSLVSFPDRAPPHLLCRQEPSSCHDYEADLPQESRRPVLTDGNTPGRDYATAIAIGMAVFLVAAIVLLVIIVSLFCWLMPK